MIDVTHHRDDRRPLNQIFRRVLFIFINGFQIFGCTELHFVAKFFRNNGNRFRIETLVDGYKKSKRHTGRNDLRDLHIHHLRQLVGTHEFRNSQ